MKSVSLIGAGAVGRSIALALFYGGVKIDHIYSLNGISARQLARTVGASTFGTIEEMVSVGTHTIICVPDREIRMIANLIAKRIASLKNKIFIHTSGGMTSDELLPLKVKGAIVGSFHPMQTFPKKKITTFNNVWCAVEGDTRARTFCRNIAAVVGAHTFTIPKKGKVLYHTAGVFASNYVVTLLSVTEFLAKECGIPERAVWKIFKPILMQTVNNVVTTSPAEALTGPIARGDVATVTKQLQALSTKKLHHLVPLYSALGIETARLARKKTMTDRR